MKRGLKYLLGYFLIKKFIVGYIDPNTGGMLFQFLAVIFALLSTAFLFFSGQIKAFFARLRRNVREHGDGDSGMGGESLENFEDFPDSEI